jgi:acetyltransferase-like isoleucine patch superfamily enzyme
MRQYRKGSIYETAKITPQTELELAEGAWIGDFVFVNLEKLILGKGSQVGAFASLTGGGNVHVGQYTTIGYGVRVIAGTDTPEGRYMADKAPLNERRVVRGSVKIGDNCFIGANAVISVSKSHPLIQIEDNVVVGALSYVGEDVARDTVGWGAPFRPVKRRKVKA